MENSIKRYVFGQLCSPEFDGENIAKLKEECIDCYV